MPATTIHFVRHGKVENPGHLLYERLPGFHLSDVGVNSVRGLRGEEPLELQTDERLIEARNEFRGKRIGFGEGALWKNGNWKLVRNLWKPSWGESYQSIAHRMQDFALEKVAEHTALASITSITYDCNTGKIMSITYADPAADVE